MGFSIDVGIAHLLRFPPSVCTFPFATHSPTDVQQLSRIVLMRTNRAHVGRRKDAGQA